MKSTITKGILAGTAFFFAVFSPQEIHAQTVAWGSAFGSKLLDSKGDPLGSDFKFELGTFNDNFNPATTDPSLWAADWQGFDLASTANNGFSSTVGFINRSVAIAENGQTTSTAFEPAVQDYDFRSSELYIWAYRDSKTVEGGNEFALITDPDWDFPATVSPTGAPLSFRLADTNTAILGESQNASFSLKTVAVGVAVPEPSTGLLLAIGLSGWLIRRKREN